jgi:hypothetical protein
MLVGLNLDTASAGSLSPDYAAMQEAYQTRSLSVVEYAELVIQALTDPGSLDSAWLTEHAVPGFCLTPIIKDIERVAREDPAAQEALKGLRSRPDKQATFVSPEGLFTIHYDTTGTHAVLDPDVDVDPADGVPDYVNRCAEYFDYAWHFQVDTLGYDPPGSDYGLGGSDDYDVYIHHNAGAAGMTYSDGAYIPPEYAGRPDARCTHVHVDPTMAEFAVLEDPLPLLMTTAAHELHHGIQGVYDWFTYPWAEQTAVWMEEVVHDELDPYIKYFDYCSLVGDQSYLDVPHRYLYTHSGMIHYTAVVWPLFLEHQFGRDCMRQTWVELISPAVGEQQAVEIVLQNHGSSHAVAVPEFQVWNYFTEERDDGYHYEEGDSLPLVHVMTEHTAFPVLNAGPLAGEKPQGYGCNYIEFPELEGIDHLRIAFSDENATVQDWGVSFALWDPDTSDCVAMTVASGEGEIIVYPGGASTIIMIPTCVTSTGTSPNDYSYSVWANECLLSGELAAGQLVLTWFPRAGAASYWVYGADNQAHFEPGFAPSYLYRLATLSPIATTWSSANGVGDPDHNWTYLVLAVDATEQELIRSNHVGEFDFGTDATP